MAYEKQTYNNVIIGYGIRGSLGGDTTFRVRRGNGYYGAIAGHVYQDKFTLVIPSSINNPEGAPYRALLKAAVETWQLTLTAAQKKEYNRRASHGLKMSGYNLFIREVMTGVYDMFVDRGDISDYDFTKADLTTDGTWRELDLSGIISRGARAVLMRVLITDDLTNSVFCMRRCGNENTYNQEIRFTKHANFLRHCTFIVHVNSARCVDYFATNTTWTTINLIVRGWWT